MECISVKWRCIDKNYTHAHIQVERNGISKSNSNNLISSLSSFFFSLPLSRLLVACEPSLSSQINLRPTTTSTRPLVDYLRGFRGSLEEALVNALNGMFAHETIISEQLSLLIDCTQVNECAISWNKYSSLLYLKDIQASKEILLAIISSLGISLMRSPTERENRLIHLMRHSLQKASQIVLNWTSDNY